MKTGTSLAVVEIAGDVDFESGSLDVPTDVLVRGDVKDAFHVCSRKNIAVKGVIGACRVAAGGDIQASGVCARAGPACIKRREQRPRTNTNNVCRTQPAAMYFHAFII